MLGVRGAECVCGLAGCLVSRGAGGLGLTGPLLLRLRRGVVAGTGPGAPVSPGLLVAACPGRGLLGLGLAGSLTARTAAGGPPRMPGRVLGRGWEDTTRSGATVGDLATWLPFGVATVTVVVVVSAVVVVVAVPS